MMSILHWLQDVGETKEVNTFLENILRNFIEVFFFTGGPEKDTWGDIFLEAELIISACCRRIFSSASMSETFSSSLKI